MPFSKDAQEKDGRGTIVKTLCFGVLMLTFAAVLAGRQEKVPVHLSHTGRDEVGSLLMEALKAELSKSATYEVVSHNDEPKSDTKLQFYIEVATTDIATDDSRRGQSSAVSIVIERMDRDSYPVPFKWYHKIILVRRQNVDETAKLVVADIYACWCNTVKSSAGGCPKEQL